MYPDDPVGVFTAVQCAVRTMRFAPVVVIIAGPTTASSRERARNDPVITGAIRRPRWPEKIPMQSGPKGHETGR